MDFAGDISDFSQGRDCSSLGCARLMFSFALGDNAAYDSEKKADIRPHHSEHKPGHPINGSQFLIIYRSMGYNNKNGIPHKTNLWRYCL